MKSLEKNFQRSSVRIATFERYSAFSMQPAMKLSSGKYPFNMDIFSKPDNKITVHYSCTIKLTLDLWWKE